MLTAYFDESYNNRTMTIGGWITDDSVWDNLTISWNKKVKVEQRKSLRNGETPISRYHAADCSNFRNEFSLWDRDRQALFSKRLISIIGNNRPYGIVVGASIDDLLKYFPESKKDWKAILYYLCLHNCLLEVGQLMAKKFPNDQVAIIHDRSPKLNGKAGEAFEGLKQNVDFPEGKYFTTIAPMGWEDCTPLQPADLIAYEGFKLFEARRDNRAIRRSLTAIIGTDVPLRAGWVKEEYFKTFKARHGMK